MASVRQYSTPPNEWLYQDNEDGTRIYTDYVIRSEESEPWNECTNAEKEEWEAEHPQPIPDEIDRITM